MTTPKDTLMEQIESGALTMRPRWHFVLKAALVFSLLVVAMIFLAYVVNFILFLLVSSGTVWMPLFGFTGVMYFLYELPWILALASLSLFGFLYVLVKQFAFAYRKPVLLVVGGILLYTACASFFVYASPLNQLLEARVVAGQRGVPEILHVWYHSTAPRVIEGEVITVKKEAFELRNRKLDVVVVRLSPDTRMPQTAISVGDVVVVFGSWRSGAIDALGVRYRSW